jgi:hypothetical protein
LILTALVVAIAAIIDWRRNPVPPAPPRRTRVQRGALLRFDSVTKIVELCRRRYMTEKVQCDSTTGELLLWVVRPDGEEFESLVVHFESEGQYVVLLPET